ncbi:hypothetical protein BGZ98_003803, partial [Dissophora globulifera]
GVQARQKLLEDKFVKGVKSNPFPDGSYVMTLDPVTSNALLPKWEGPYKVVRRNQGGAYILQDLTGALLSSNCAPSRMKLVKRDAIDDTDDVFEIQQIVDHRPSPEGGSEMEYLVRWKGYSPEHDSWIPFSNFIETTMIEAYRKRRGIAMSGERSGKLAEARLRVRNGRAASVLGSRTKPSRDRHVQRPSRRQPVRQQPVRRQPVRQRRQKMQL